MSDQTDHGSYGQFCPVAMAAEIVCSRWTALVLRELLCGRARFSDLRRGLPRMSPSLLSRRLKELEEAGIVVTRASDRAGAVEYELTKAGEDLRNIINSLGIWGQRWIESSLSLRHLDPSLLLWDMRRNLAVSHLPARRCTLKFTFPELAATRKSYWIVTEAGEADFCIVDPGYEIDLYVQTSLYNMTAVWMGISTLQAEIEAGHIELSGEPSLVRSMNSWLGLSTFAGEKRRIDAKPVARR